MPLLTLLDRPNFFTPNPGAQHQFLDDYTHRYCALAGGWFAGKTWAGARKLLDLHVHNAFDANDQPTFVKSAVIAPTYQLANDFDLPELRRAMDEMGLSYEFIQDPKRYCFTLRDLGTRDTPSEILIRTADSPDRITGWTVGALWGDEAARWKCDPYNPTNDPFLQADARLRDPRAAFLQFLLTFTHEGDDTRVYRDFEFAPKPDHVLYRAGTSDNPHAAAFAKVQREQLSADLANQYLHGHALSTAGQKLYSRFDESRNVFPALAISPTHPLQLTLDFNISPGMHAIVGQHFAERDQVTALYELHHKHMSVVDVVIAFADLLTRQLANYPLSAPVQIFGDATGGSHWAGGGQSCYDVLYEELRAYGIPFQKRVPKTNPHVSDRVHTVNSAFCTATGQTRYLIHPRCKRLIDDYRTMRWDARGAEPDKRDQKQSHASDADGYRIHYLCPIRRDTRIGQIGIFNG